jgi:photosystem II stability/assembly factor-like uncharacterized protein
VTTNWKAGRRRGVLPGITAAAVLAVSLAACSTASTAVGSTSGARTPPAAGARPAAVTLAGARLTPASATGAPRAPAALPPGGPVPAGFKPRSATFVSAATGYVLGVVTTCPSHRCVAILRTTDGGTKWVSLGAPPGRYGTTVSEVRFADPLDGWAFGPDLYVTHDGARTWQLVDLGGAVDQLAASDGYVDAVSSCIPMGCSGRVSLWQASASGGDFTKVLVSSKVFQDTKLALHGSVGFVVFGPSQVYATENLADTHGWKPFPDPCSGLKNFSLSSIVAPNGTTLYTVCWGNGATGRSTKDVVVTQGGHSKVAGATPENGIAGTIAATPSGRTLVLATSSGASYLYRSTDGGRLWVDSILFRDGGLGFNDLGFTTAKLGFVIRGAVAWRSKLDDMMMTDNAGATWYRVRFG